MPSAPSSPDREPLSNETSAGHERECRRTDDQSEGRYGEKQNEAAREAKPGEGARKQPLLLLQLESRVMRNGKPHQQVQARQWQDLAQIEHQHDRKDEYPDRKHRVTRRLEARMHLSEPYRQFVRLAHGEADTDRKSVV